MEAAGFRVEQSSDSLNGSRKENDSDKDKEREIESSKCIAQTGGEYHQCQTPHHWASRLTDSSYQNLAEYVGALVGILCLVDMGIKCEG